MKLNYEQWNNRARSLAFVNTEPTKTDQSGAADTDINVIVKRYGVYGTVPAGKKQPQFGVDMSEIPTDLADVIEAARMLEIYRGELPPALRAINIDDLITMTPDAIASILNPPAPKPENKETTT